MNIIRLRPYKRLDDDDLIRNAYNKMNQLRYLCKKKDINKYFKESLYFNEMIIEIKNRNLSIKEYDLIKNILK